MDPGPSWSSIASGAAAQAPPAPPVESPASAPMPPPAPTGPSPHSRPLSALAMRQRSAEAAEEEVVYSPPRAPGPQPSLPPGTPPDEPQTLLILVGLPGSGKSTFAHALELLPGRPWVRASQDDSVSKRRGEVEDTVRRALRGGSNVVVDRVNFDAAQRAHFIDLARSMPAPPRVWALVLTAPEAVLRDRLTRRTGHPTLTDATTALSVLGRMRRQMVLPDPREGFERVLVLEWRGEGAGEVLREIEAVGRSSGGRGGRGGRGGIGGGRGRGGGNWGGRGRGWGMPRGRGSPGGRRRSGGHPSPVAGNGPLPGYADVWSGFRAADGRLGQ